MEQRDSFIQTFFRKGAELTEELLGEADRLRSRILELETENSALRSQVSADDAIRELLGKIETLEKERSELLTRSAAIRATAERYDRRYAEIEAENAQLANLYVASYQLHSTLDLATIVRRVRELLNQLVGARLYAVYLHDDERGVLAPVVTEGPGTNELAPVKRGDGPIGRCFDSGELWWTDTDPSRGSLTAPAACIPMQLSDRCVGVVVVFATFEQKTAFVDVDFELFRLLGAHTATALAASRLVALHGSRIGSLEAFLDLE